MTYKNLALSQTEDPFYTTFVAIRNKTTGKTRLIEANEVVLAPEVTHPRSVLTRFVTHRFNPWATNESQTDFAGYVMTLMIHCLRSTNPVLLQEDNQQKKTLEEKIESSKHLINSFGQSKGIRYEYSQLIF